MLEPKYPNIVDKIRKHQLNVISYKIVDFSNYYIPSYNPCEINFVNGILLNNLTKKESILISRLDNHCKQNKNDFAAKLELSKEKAKKNIFDLGVHFFYYNSFYSEDMEKFYENLDDAKKYHFELGFENTDKMKNIYIILDSLNGLDNIQMNVKEYAFLIASFFNSIDKGEFLKKSVSFKSDINDFSIQDMPDFIDHIIEDLDDYPLSKEIYQDMFLERVSQFSKNPNKITEQDIDVLCLYAKKGNINIESYLYELKQKITFRSH